MDDRHASDCAVHNGQDPCDCGVDLIERARKMAAEKRYPMVAADTGAPIAAIVGPEELTAMKAVIRGLADALEARLPKGES